MTVLRKHIFLTALLYSATSLNAYEPWALDVLPSSSCDFEYCYDATISRVGNISNDARASTRDSPGLYLIPAKDLLLHVVQPEQCFTACLGMMNVSSDDALTQYNIPNTATLHCLDNLSVFLCIATCVWHVNSYWPDFHGSLEPGQENLDLYNPYKEIQFHRDRQYLLSLTSMGNQSTKHAKRFRELNTTLHSLLANPQCSDLCYVPEFGICASAFDGNIGKQECVSACFNSYLCSAMCNQTLNLSEAIVRSDKQGLLPVPATPVQPPAMYLSDDIQLQKNFPALSYNISGTDTASMNASTPVGLIWKVEPLNSTDIFYYATHFRHPFNQSSRALETEHVYHLFVHYNHSGVAGYLRIVQFCESANISYAFVNAGGCSGFSPSTTVCFPGEYQPSTPQNMSIDASFNTQGLLEVNITCARSPDHDLVQSYEINAALQEGHLPDLHCPEQKLFSITVQKSEGLSFVMNRRQLQEYNFTSVWNCNVTFLVLVNPRTPNTTLKRYQESEDKAYKPKQMIASFLLQEVEILHPEVTYYHNNTYNRTSGRADVVIQGAVINNSSNVSLKLEMFLNSLQAKLVKLSRSQQILNEEETKILNFSSGDEVIVFNNVSPTSDGEVYSLKLSPGCCFIVNTKYREIFKEQNWTISINPVSPSNLRNLTVLNYPSGSGTVTFNISWQNSMFPYGNNSFNVLVSTSNGTEVLLNKTIFHRSNGKEAVVLPSQRFETLVTLTISRSGSYDFAVRAKSNWGACSAWINTSVFVEHHLAGPHDFAIYGVVLPCVVGAVAAILLIVLIVACVCYYQKNKVVVIPTSSLFVENAVTMDDGMDGECPLQDMDSWELGPQDIIILGQLGEGNFGEVYRGLVKFEANAPAARHHSETLGNLLVAVKLLKSDATITLKSEFLREIALMKKVSGDVCPYVVNMIGCCTHEEPIALVLEYASNGDLLRYLRAMRKLCDEPEQVESGENENQYVNGPEESTCEDILGETDLPVANAGTECPVIEEVTPANFISYGWQIASGMEYLSQLGIVHRDLACRNVLVCSNKQLKVSDFGLAREDECYVKTTEGKLPLRWMATESIEERVFTTKSDVWSFGVTLWEITTFGGHPYPTLGNRALLSYLLSGKTLEKPMNCSEEWYHLMSLCWALNPHNRPHFKELRVKLEEMLNNVHRAHYIDLNAGADDMPYYPMSAASVAESSEDEIPLQLSTGQFHTPYLEPQSFLDESTGEGPLPLRVARPSDSSSSTGEAMPAEASCMDTQNADTQL